MNRFRYITKPPQRAQDVAPEVKLTFIRDIVDASGENSAFSDVLTASIPLFVNKDPSNPASD